VIVNSTIHIIIHNQQWHAPASVCTACAWVYECCPCSSVIHKMAM